jgi:four helix bundle protein
VNCELGRKNKKMENKNKIKSFTDLEVWKEGHFLVIMIYKVTKQFPKDEVFGLINQMRRCVVSITSNIAEGFSRQSKKEKLKFYFISLGSLTELQNQLLIAKDPEIKYINQQDFDRIVQQAITVHKLLCGLIRATKKM